MAVDTIVRNCKIVSPEGLSQEDIAINSGKIVAIGDATYLPQADKTIDAQGHYVLPGIIDGHVHVGLFHPLKDEVKDTAAAAFAGTTTVGNYVGMGASAQRRSYADGFDQWKEIWEENAFVDSFFHGGVISEEIMLEIPENARRYGIISHKFMMSSKGPEAEKMGNAQTDDGFLWFGFKNITSLGYPARAMVHAEDIDIIRRMTSAVKDSKRQDLEAWDEARPGFCETLDVERAISLARKNSTPLYIVHVSNGASVDVIARAKAEGIDVIGETCPQYLTLSRSSSLGALCKIAPPLRDEPSQERLWQGIREGTIECIGSDHCSTTKEMKKNLWEGPPGAPGMGTLLPIMLSEGVNKGKITLEKLVEVCCFNNAKISGIYPQKGTLQVGSDADLVIIDLHKKVKLTPEQMHYEVADYSPFEGWEVKGWPVLTMLRGRVIVEDGKFASTPGVGKYIPRELA